MFGKKEFKIYKIVKYKYIFAKTEFKIGKMIK